MNISLTKHLETFVNGKVESGRYHSASEVIREGLRLLEEHDALRNLQRQDLRRAIAQGTAELDRGEGIPGDKAFAEIRESMQGQKKRRKRK